MLDGPAMRAEVASPTYRGGVWDHTGSGILDPGKLAAGLRDAAIRAGVRVYEHSAVHDIGDDVLTAAGRVRARKVLLATSAYPPLLSAIRRYVVPVYDYALVTEPVDLSEIGWQNRQGIGDGGNQFHYYRLTADNRILYGGWDAVYRYRGPVGPRHDDHEPTFATLAQHFFHTFPQLEGTRFTHRWGGAIDTSSRFSVFFGTARGGRLAYATGYTGLGVAAARFGGRTALDLLDGRDDRGDAAALRALQADPVPARAAALGGDPVHAQPARGGRPKRRPPRPLAQDARPPRPRLRLLKGTVPFTSSLDLARLIPLAPRRCRWRRCR